MTSLRCLCGSWIADGLHTLSDTPDGLFAVVDVPVADHVHECRCGHDIAITSSAPVVECPGQLVLIQGGTVHTPSESPRNAARRPGA